MSIDTSTLISELRLHLGEDDIDLPDNDALLLLNRSYWEIIDKFPFREKEVTATFSTVAAQRLYGVPTPFEALRQVSVLNPDTNDHEVLEVMSILDYENKYSEDTSEQAMPTGYVREGCNIRLYPTPDTVYTLTLKYWSPLTDLSLTQAPTNPQVWHECILFGAVYRGFFRRSDYARGNQAKAHQKSIIDTIVPVEAKEEVDTPMAGLQAMRPDYDV